MKQLILLRETWFHMSEKSGFDPLFATLERDSAVNTTSIFVPYHVIADSRWDRLVQRFHTPPPVPAAPSPLVEARHEQAGRLLSTVAARTPGSRIILSAAENQYGGVLSHGGNNLRSSIFACFHQPPSWLRLHWRDMATLDGLAGIICLGGEQRDYFRQVTSSPVLCIRHGVMLDFFTPPPLPCSRNRARLLFVGQWLRDFETLDAAMQLIWEENPRVELDCVIIRRARQSPALLRLARDARVHWHAGISPEQLRDLYHQSTLLFLPLIDAVANNAIVEALASGLPVISTRVGAIPEYIPESSGELCTPGDAADHAQAVINWLADEPRMAVATKAGRAFAESHLDWKRIADDLATHLL